MSKKPDWATLTLNLPRDMKETIDRVAKNEDRKTSQYIRHVLNKELRSIDPNELSNYPPSEVARISL